MSKRRKTRVTQHSEVLRRILKKPLSRRESQVLIALGEGKTSPEIRSSLRIARRTLDSYLARLKHKLELANIHQLIRAAALLRESIIPSTSNTSRNGSPRLCP